MTRKGKEIPRLPLSAFSPPNTGTSDTFPLPPTPSVVSPRGVVDAHLHTALDPPTADISHLAHVHNRAVVLSPTGQSADAIVASLPSLLSDLVSAPVIGVLIPVALDTTETLASVSAMTSPALTTTYDGATPVVAEAEGASARVLSSVGEGETNDQERPVKNLRWALQHARVVDLNIQGGIIAIDTSAYDSLVNLLAKAIKSATDTKRTPIVLTNVLLPPLDAITPVVTMMNHPSYNTYRQRVSSLSLFENAYVKLLPPTWVATESPPGSGGEQDKELKGILKLFIDPVLEAFGFERIIFGSSPASTSGSPALAENWYKLVLESFRELAVSQDELDKIFIDNAERVYGPAQ
jgi:hypothetical protein